MAVNELPMKYKSYEGVKKILPNCIKNFIYGRMGRKYDIGRIHDIDISFYRDLIHVDKYLKYPNLYSIYLNRLTSVEVLRKKFNIQP